MANLTATLHWFGFEPLVPLHEPNGITQSTNPNRQSLPNQIATRHHKVHGRSFLRGRLCRFFGFSRSKRERFCFSRSFSRSKRERFRISRSKRERLLCNEMTSRSRLGLLLSPRRRRRTRNRRRGRVSQSRKRRRTQSWTLTR